LKLQLRKFGKENSLLLRRTGGYARRVIKRLLKKKIEGEAFMDKIERTMSLLITIFAISFIVFSIMSLFKPVAAFAAKSAVTCEFVLVFLGVLIFVYDWRVKGSIYKRIKEKNNFTPNSTRDSFMLEDERIEKKEKPIKDEDF
jgi:hypothetical protein